MALLSLAEAQQRVLDGAAALGVEEIAVAAAAHRVLARDLDARRTQPPTDVSAMDGYAVRAADAASPSGLRIIGESAAGHPFDGVLQPGSAVRIFTGAVVPEGADCVVLQEDCVVDQTTRLVQPPSRVELGQHIRRKGSDFAVGRMMLQAGQRLSPRDIALAAAMNHAALPVFRKPRVTLISTGDELVLPGRATEDRHIVSSNALCLAAILSGEGAEVVDLGLVPDRLEATRAAIQAARDMGADVLVTTGGASVGDHDLVHKAFAAEGVALGFWKIALRPGKPMMFGRLGAMRVLGLPGNPVSSFIGALLFVQPLVRALSGRGDVLPVEEPAILGSDLPRSGSRLEYMRARLERPVDGGVPTAIPFPDQDSSLLSVLAAAEACVIRPADAPAAKAGEPCRIIRLPS